jgi:sugar phosphate isomerase/epimerase
MINKLAINTVGEELVESANFCRSRKIGIEITDFAYPANLDNVISGKIAFHKKTVTEISPVISHGPFFDLIVTSPDSAIVEISRKRHLVSLNAAIDIGAAFYIAHTNFNPLIRNLTYLNSYTKRMLNFWLPFADYAANNNITICFENLWETGPEIQAELLSSANHPNLRASFDNGHALVFSQQPAKKWIEVLGSMLAHCHLHDNMGALDEHKSIGEGKEDWPELINAIQRFAPNAILVAESDKLAANKVSLEKLKGFQ